MFDITNLTRKIEDLEDEVLEHLKESICSGAFYLTKREHFAAMAMQGLVSALRSDPRNIAMKDTAEISFLAVKTADSLIKELEEKK